MSAICINYQYVQEQIDRATSVSRTEALKTSEIKNIERVPLVVTYHPQLPCLGKILRNHLPTLHILETMKKAVPNPPLVANRQPKNLKDLLVRVMMKPPQQLYEGTSPCGKPRCKSCMHIRTGNAFESARTGEKFQAHVTANCKTKNILYLIQCRKCKKTVYRGDGEPLVSMDEWP